MEMDERVRRGRLAYWDPDFKTRLGTEKDEPGFGVPGAARPAPRDPP